MVDSLKSKFSQLAEKLSRFFVGGDISENTYCIPCKWVYSGNVYVVAPNLAVAEEYVETHDILPDIENCIHIQARHDTKHPILCTCGNCNSEYVVSKLHNPTHCPNCGNGCT